MVLPKDKSEWVSISAGVPPGSILGPLLFLVYINDTVSDIDSTIRLFADDTRVGRKTLGLTQLSSRSHPRHLVGKRTAQKDITIDTTSDSQVNSNFPNRWSSASLTFNNYFYLFLYLYIT